MIDKSRALPKVSEWLFGRFIVSVLLILVSIIGSTGIVEPTSVNGLMSVAQAESEPNVGIVDIQRVIDRSQIGQDAKQKVEAIAKKEQVKLQQLKEEYSRTQAEVEKQEAVLSGKALEEKVLSLKKREREIARTITDRRDELVRQNRAEVAQVVRQVDKVAQAFGKQHGYIVVLEADPAVVLHYSKKLDITEKIIQALDADSL